MNVYIYTSVNVDMCVYLHNCAYTCIYIYLDVYGHYGYLWTSMDIYDNLWISMDTYGFLDVYGYAYIALAIMDIYGHIWTINGYLRICMDVYG